MNYNIVGIIKFLRCIGGKRSFVIVLDDEDQHTISPCVSKTIFLRNSFNQLGCVAVFLFLKPLILYFFLVFAMAEHENRQKFVTSYEGQLGRNLCMVVCLQKQTEMQKFCYSFITRFCFVFLTTHSDLEVVMVP